MEEKKECDEQSSGLKKHITVEPGAALNFIISTSDLYKEQLASQSNNTCKECGRPKVEGALEVYRDPRFSERTDGDPSDN